MQKPFSGRCKSPDGSVPIVPAVPAPGGREADTGPGAAAPLAILTARRIAHFPQPHKVN